MKDQNRKSTWALCLSISAILLCLLVFALWAIEVIPRSVVSAESFIGACVALLGVIVTVAVIMLLRCNDKGCEAYLYVSDAIRYLV